MGVLNIRNDLNDYLLNYGGHIGYGVRPSERGKGYATFILKRALFLLRGLGILKVLLTCEKTNTASAKTILKCDGILENEVRKDDLLIQRYWVIP
ncbi:MAG: GNAT family N-acetyltransferase [Methanosarcinaceae archaeon]|nr:GNAT family N-acetyltransferase [Methanosarcinaceae archaeon]